MTRRGLISALLAAATDPERLLWTPGKKLISIPKRVEPIIHLRLYRIPVQTGIGGTMCVYQDTKLVAKYPIPRISYISQYMTEAEAKQWKAVRA